MAQEFMALWRHSAAQFLHRRRSATFGRRPLLPAAVLVIMATIMIISVTLIQVDQICMFVGMSPLAAFWRIGRAELETPVVLIGLQSRAR